MAYLIGHGDETLGNLYLTDKAGGEEFTSEDEVVLLLFAAQASVVIRNASLHNMVDMERRCLDAILNDAPNGMIYIEKATGKLQANRRAEEMLQCSLGQSDRLATLEARCHTAEGILIPPGQEPLKQGASGGAYRGKRACHHL